MMSVATEPGTGQVPVGHGGDSTKVSVDEKVRLPEKDLSELEAYFAELAAIFLTMARTNLRSLSLRLVA